MAVKKTRKVSGLVIYSYLKNGAFTAVKRNAAFYTKDVKGVPLTIKGTRGILKGRGWTSGQSLPIQKFC